MSTIDVYRYGGLLTLEDAHVEVMTFPGGEPHAKVANPAIVDGSSYVIDARISDFNGIGQILVVNDTLRRLGAGRVSLFLPYVPGARQDRGAPLTARVYADLINAAEFDLVVGVDVHSDVAPALYDNFVSIPAERVFPKGVFPLAAKACMVIPDAGAVKRVSAIADKFGYITFQALKHRDPKSGHLSMFTCEEISPEFDHAIIVDDICDGGGTFLGLAPKIQWQTGNQPKLHLWTTHGIYSKGLDELRKVFTTIACTDSFPGPTPDDRVLLLPYMAQALSRDPLAIQRTG